MVKNINMFLQMYLNRLCISSNARLWKREENITINANSKTIRYVTNERVFIRT